jgi:hypothetical protein
MERRAQPRKAIAPTVVGPLLFARERQWHHRRDGGKCTIRKAATTIPRD